MMDPFNWNFWYVWPMGIAFWLILGWCEFGYFESRAIEYASSKRITLSYFVYYVSTKFPLAMAVGMFLWGGFVMGLCVHFFWHWCPPGSISAG